MRRPSTWHAALAAAVMVSASSTHVPRARACGGLFCSGGGGPTVNANFVNQTAERIAFIDHPDGTVTAIIQIVYEGPADRFAWLLPVPGVPEVAVSSTVVLDALQQQTNPQYQVTTTRESCAPPNFGLPDSCRCGGCMFAPTGAAPPSGPGDVGSLGGPAVSVEATGSVGPYDWTVISVQPFALDPATAAIDWLTENEFDVGQLGPEVLRPYLQDGLNLLAFRLNKQADVGSIRPVMLTYAAEQPSIPLRPTAVAANDDMGVLVWVMAQAQVVPTTYRSIVLNEALVDWFNPASNYVAVVTEAANEAGGQAFTTEFAGAFQGAATLVSTADWDGFDPQPHHGWIAVAVEANAAWGTWDGFDEALAAAITLPEGVALDDLKNCLPLLTPELPPEDACARFASAPLVLDIQLDGQLFREELQTQVIDPVTTTLAALASQPYLTRLYTTLSPDEMTADPVFDVNAELADVPNVHAADRWVPCSSALGTMTLPQGATIATDPNSNAWPVPMDLLPAALQVIQHGTSGPGIVLVDERASVQNATFGLGACQMGLGGADSRDGVTGTAGTGARDAPGTADDGADGPVRPGEVTGERHERVEACAVSAPGTRARGGVLVALLALCAFCLGHTRARRGERVR